MVKENNDWKPTTHTYLESLMCCIIITMFH